MTTEPTSKQPKVHHQAKVMLILSVVFFGGIAALSVTPEDYRGLVMGAIMALTLWAMFRG